MPDNEAFHTSFPSGPPLPPGQNVFWSAHRFRGAAGARGFTHAQFLTALVSLHEAMRKRADDGDAEMAAALDQLGLGTVSI